MLLFSKTLRSEIPGGSTRDPDKGVETRHLEPALNELSPFIEGVEFERLDSNSLAVHIQAVANTDCYSEKEYQITRDKNQIRIVPRLARPLGEQSDNCQGQLQEYKDRAYVSELSEALEKEFWVLGFHGWHKAKIPNEILAKLSPIELGPLRPSPPQLSGENAEN